MVLVTFRPRLAGLLISPREETDLSDGTSKYLEEEIRVGRWDSISPIWITPNYAFNGLTNWTVKPFVVYNGHHRLKKALEHNLAIPAYIRFTPGNPLLPEDERLYCIYPEF